MHRTETLQSFYLRNSAKETEKAIPQIAIQLQLSKVYFSRVCITFANKATVSHIACKYMYQISPLYMSCSVCVVYTIAVWLSATQL